MLLEGAASFKIARVVLRLDWRAGWGNVVQLEIAVSRGIVLKVFNGGELIEAQRNGRDGENR